MADWLCGGGLADDGGDQLSIGLVAVAGRCRGLGALRFIIMGRFSTLCKPEFLRVTVEEQPEVVVLTDATHSMDTRDVVTGARDVVTRQEWLAGQMATNFWSPLEKLAKVTVQIWDELH